VGSLVLVSNDSSCERCCENAFGANKSLEIRRNSVEITRKEQTNCWYLFTISWFHVISREETSKRDFRNVSGQR
jgi:hypothetical protein